MPMLRRIIAFVVAVATLVALGSITQSLFVQRAWSIAAGQADGGASVAIPIADRIAWIGHDFSGIFMSYGGVTGSTLLVALLLAGWLTRYTGHRVLVFGLASATGIFTLFMLLRRLLGTVGIFGVRGAFGLAAQMAVALVAGLLFAHLTRPRTA
jgi:hypothetical protein